MNQSGKKLGRSRALLIFGSLGVLLFGLVTLRLLRPKLGNDIIILFFYGFYLVIKWISELGQ